MGHPRSSSRLVNTLKMGDHELLDIEEWELVLNKMLKFHFNISEEIKAVVQAIRTEMKPELIPLAEDKANFGKVVKKAIREMWHSNTKLMIFRQNSLTLLEIWTLKTWTWTSSRT